MLFFKKSKSSTASLDSPNTVIGKEVYLESALMSGQESIRIEGTFKGNIEVNGSLVLGESGSIYGNVEANYFIVAGKVVGNIKCLTQLHFASTARVEGDIQTASLIIDEGSKVSGRYIVGAEKLDQALLKTPPAAKLTDETYDERYDLRNYKDEFE